MRILSFVTSSRSSLILVGQHSLMAFTSCTGTIKSKKKKLKLKMKWRRKQSVVGWKNKSKIKKIYSRCAPKWSKTNETFAIICAFAYQLYTTCEYSHYCLHFFYLFLTHFFLSFFAISYSFVFKVYKREFKMDRWSALVLSSMSCQRCEVSVLRVIRRHTNTFSRLSSSHCHLCTHRWSVHRFHDQINDSKVCTNAK